MRNLLGYLYDFHVKMKYYLDTKKIMIKHLYVGVIR